MAELYREDAEDDDEDEKDAKQSNKPIPKKLPLIPSTEKPAPPPQEAIRIGELLPNVIDKPKPLFEAEADDDEEGEAAEKEAEQSPEAAAVEKAAEAVEGVPENDILELSEEMVHLREPGPAAEAKPEATAAESGEEEEPEQSTTTTPAPPPSAPARPTPPVAPVRPAFTPPPGPDRAPSFTPNTYTGPTPELVNAEVKKVSDKAEEERKRNMQLIIVGGVVTGLLLREYIKSKNEAVKLGLDLVQDQLSTVLKKTEKVAAASRPAPRPPERPAVPVAEKPTVPPAAEAVVVQQQVEQIFDMQGNEITLQPGWHVERSSGGYSVVLDEHNRVVHDAIHYGEAFKRDKKREQLDDDVFAALAGGGASGGGSATGNHSPAGQATGQPSQSAPAPVPDVLLGGQPTVDIEHRLPKSHASPLAALASPWLWMAIAILIIIYFVAALA